MIRRYDVKISIKQQIAPTLPGKEALEDGSESLSVFLKALLIYCHNLQKKPGKKKRIKSIRDFTSLEMLICSKESDN